MSAIKHLPSPDPELVRPYSPAPPLQQDYIRQQISKQQKNNFHSTSLKMVSTVNKTNLHPGGIQPQREHTEIEEELHEKAHIDYDRVAIVSWKTHELLLDSMLISGHRLPTLLPQPSMKTPWFTRLDPPSHHQELFRHTLELRLAALPQTSVSSMKRARTRRSGGDL